MTNVWIISRQESTYVISHVQALSRNHTCYRSCPDEKSHVVSHVLTRNHSPFMSTRKLTHDISHVQGRNEHVNHAQTRNHARFRSCPDEITHTLSCHRETYPYHVMYYGIVVSSGTEIIHNMFRREITHVISQVQTRNHVFHHVRTRNHTRYQSSPDKRSKTHKWLKRTLFNSTKQD